MAAVPSIGRASAITPTSAPPAASRGAAVTHDLYERYGRQIHAFCRNRLGSREEAEDATQSTFLNAFRGLERGVRPEFESAWLFKIAENVCLTRQRSTFRRRRVEAPGDMEALQEIVPSPQREADELIRLTESLHAVPEQQRRALLLREWQGLSYKEIAEELELSQAAVETLLFRARRSLAQALTEEPKSKVKRGKRLRAGSDLSSVLAVAKTLFIGGGAKVAATVATVAATSVVASTPAVRHELEHVVAPAKHAAHVSKPAPTPARRVTSSAPASLVDHPAAAKPKPPARKAAAKHATRRPFVFVPKRHPHAADAPAAGAPAASAPASTPTGMAPEGSSPAPAPAATPEPQAASPPTPAPPAPAAARSEEKKAATRESTSTTQTAATPSPREQRGNGNGNAKNSAKGMSPDPDPVPVPTTPGAAGPPQQNQGQDAKHDDKLGRKPDVPPPSVPPPAPMTSVPAPTIPPPAVPTTGGPPNIPPPALQDDSQNQGNGNGNGGNGNKHK